MQYAQQHGRAAVALMTHGGRQGCCVMTHVQGNWLFTCAGCIALLPSRRRRNHHTVRECLSVRCSQPLTEKVCQADFKVTQLRQLSGQFARYDVAAT